MNCKMFVTKHTYETIKKSKYFTLADFEPAPPPRTWGQTLHHMWVFLHLLTQRKPQYAHCDTNTKANEMHLIQALYKSVAVVCFTGVI